jgi:hypothetical protein
MARSTNAQIAADDFQRLRSLYGYSQSEAWKGIAELLLTCSRQQRQRWKTFHDVIVFREVNDFKLTKAGKPNATIRKAEQLSVFLAGQLGCERADLCRKIGAYWRNREVATRQQHNIVGHAFRSILTEILISYGKSGITYEEEIPARGLFPDFPMASRSKQPKIDIVAFNGPKPVAMISTRWRFRHDRVDFIDEAHSYSPAAERTYGRVPYFAVTGEFSAARLGKVLDNAPPIATGPIAAAVHFCPELVTEGLGENGRMANLKSLDWLISQTAVW